MVFSLSIWRREEGGIHSLTLEQGRGIIHTLSGEGSILFLSVKGRKTVFTLSLMGGGSINSLSGEGMMSDCGSELPSGEQKVHKGARLKKQRLRKEGYLLINIYNFDYLIWKIINKKYIF